MCGIAGILKVHPPGTPPPPPEVAIPESWLDVLDESIKHRGPDGCGRFRDRATRPDGSVVDVAFVHRRLAIIDLADGHQPMVSERGPGFPERERSHRVAVVFNGCIYNHRNLRRELQAAGHVFVTDHSDTEVLIHGWREWGHGLFAKLDGMFALTLWDSHVGSVVLARDAFGEKPLYSVQLDDSLVFGSSPPGIFAIGRRLQSKSFDILDPLRVATWLRFGWDQVWPLETWSRTTHGAAIEYPPPLKTNSDAAHWGGHWGAALEHRSNTALAETVDSLLRCSVHSRLEADVPIGIFLSGGIDSSLVAAYAREASAQAECFTVRMPDERFDESAAAAQTASLLGMRHNVLDCDANPSRDLLALIAQLGLPFGDSSLLPAYWVSTAARRSVRVALGGDGGDELFLGYERHRALAALTYAERLPRSLNSGIARTMGGPSAGSSARRRIARFFDAAANYGYKDLMAIFPESIFRALVGEEFAVESRKHFGLVMSGRTRDDPLAEMTALRADLMFYLPEDLLRKTDTASMSVALEVRAPFLARELVDRMIRVRPDVLMPDGERKGLLKAVARKYLPDEIVNRPKMGFSIPIGEWFRTDYGGMKQLLLDTLNSADPFPEDLLGLKINRQFVAKMIADHMDRKRDHSQRLYMLLVLAIWADWLRTLNTSKSN
ncbi:MAG: asparagine synthase (glutamine-hydrolyzing) [Phycisphaerales bacterium]|nr:asparagine synthase (glutamine-hydrolyzing) [Phycisphaerales bacterium]